MSARPISPRYPRTVRAGLVLAAVCALVPGASGPATAQLPQDAFLRPRAAEPFPALGDPNESRSLVGIDQETRLRIERALEYLYLNQNPDGSWSDRVGRKVHNAYWGEVHPHVGVTGLAGMAFLASGTLPNQGPRARYCVATRRAIDYLIDNTGANGFISAHGSRMYSHAFATLFLAEAYGTGVYPDDRRLHDALRRAVQLIVRGQNSQGGWRYRPGAEDADMSVTVCQVFALRAARNAGLQVPKSTIDRAIEYVKQSYNPQYGGFNYQVNLEFGGLRSRCTFPLTACGVATLYGAGDYNARELQDGLRFLWAARSEPDRAANSFDYYYGHYYAVQAAYQAGGTFWHRWYDRVRRDLLSLQEPDGSWNDLVGSCYATAMAAIILQMPYQYLPITES